MRNNPEDQQSRNFEMLSYREIFLWGLLSVAAVTLNLIGESGDGISVPSTMHSAIIATSAILTSKGLFEEILYNNVVNVNSISISLFNAAARFLPALATIAYNLGTRVNI